ncbi:transcription factor tfiih subunit [Grosmannia clavigera kw1407]|uniref:General transcription and DNA repair factor IIH subunit TFB4 n=1 Tax=Grosmannia clavigera (strain kw1407 / UAMH 11150) TaxID=655863 RepID=F0X7E5_GROCL|nr:transcription factor tfiih subunit [Grosmannia clavigera kw1407]EFX06611.1 transcription factor tfiih subunit [Grosmannia clavigera kw1407]
MDAVDASAHYEVTASEETPSLLTIVLDTNPRAWAALAAVLPLSKAVANILVFVNSHLALSSTNRVAVVASHCNRAVWLYPTPAGSSLLPKKPPSDGLDVDMADAPASHPHRPSHPDPADQSGRSANKFPQFREIETTLLQSVHDLVSSTAAADLDETTTLLSGALTLALAHINKTALTIPAAAAAANDGGSGGKRSRPRPGGVLAGSATSGNAKKTGTSAGLADSRSGKTDPVDDVGLHARILVISVSDSSPAQYIATMNAVFAAAHAGVAIDVLALRGAATFLQQAAYITRGTFVRVGADQKHGLLAYLMLAFNAASSHDVAQHLVAPSADAVDFRAACFCHRRVVDTGFVCSVCLSIFCEVPPRSDSSSVTATDLPTVECLTCGSLLRLGNYGAHPAVVPRPKKKKKRRLGPGGREDTGSTAGTPAA